MLRLQSTRVSNRLFSTAATKEGFIKTQKTWTQTKSSSPSLEVKSQSLKDALLNGVGESGPPSLKTRTSRVKYNTPIGLDKAFDAAYDYLKKKSDKKFNQLQEVEEGLSKDPTNDYLKNKKIALQIQILSSNPEVCFNFEFNEKYENDPFVIDYNEPVYREMKKKHWENHNQMLTMQRLEQLAVIPDTLPTLEPKVEVSLKFLNHTSVNRWIEPGVLLSSNATMYPPSIKIQEFEDLDLGEQKYTILVVNPDVADIENNTFKTHIQWGLSNIKLGYNHSENFISSKRLLEDTTINEIIEYLPPVPEKNLPKQRFSVWVLRQSNDVDVKLDSRDFNIREFVLNHNLSPVGAHVWRSVWDSNVSKVRELYGLPKGAVFHRVRSTKPLL